jgi:site-specific recombinase XerC
LSKTDIGGLDVGIIASVTRADILEFLVYAANDRKNGSKARARKLSSLKSLFKYLTVTTRQLKTNPAADIETPKVRPALPKYLELEESIKLLDTVKNDTSSATRERDYAIITLFLNCGMRLSELCGINLSDTDSGVKIAESVGQGFKAARHISERRLPQRPSGLARGQSKRQSDKSGQPRRDVHKLAPLKNIEQNRSVDGQPLS